MIHTGNCEHCKKEFSRRYTPKHHSVPRFCCRSCANSVLKIGNKNNSKEKENRQFMCEWCGKINHAIPSNTRARFCNKSCLGKHNGKRKTEISKNSNKKTERICENCYKKFDRYTCELKDVRRNNGRFCCRGCNITFHNNLRNKLKPRTSIEIKMEKTINYLGVFNVPQLKIDRFTVDLFIPEFKIAIECDGDYWHSLPKSIERDKRKNEFLKSKGYTVLRFSESKINKDIQSCIDEIRFTILTSYLFFNNRYI